MKDTLLRSIPWDVWVAAAMAVAVALVAVFDPVPAFFIFACLVLCVYIATKAFGSER